MAAKYVTTISELLKLKNTQYSYIFIRYCNTYDEIAFAFSLHKHICESEIVVYSGPAKNIERLKNILLRGTRTFFYSEDLQIFVCYSMYFKLNAENNKKSDICMHLIPPIITVKEDNSYLFRGDAISGYKTSISSYPDLSRHEKIDAEFKSAITSGQPIQSFGTMFELVMFISKIEFSEAPKM